MSLALLHSAHAVTWSAWHLEPTIVAATLVAVTLYAALLRRARGGYEAWRPAAFAAGTLVILLSLVSPLDAAAGHLLSMHMLQHVALTTLGPPLVLLGLPPAGLRAVLPEGGRAFGLLSRLTAPFVAGSLFLLNMWLWHAPPVYEEALRHLSLHVAMHIAFMATGLLFWWPIVAPHAQMSSAAGGARLLYLFVTGFPMGVLALLLLASQTVIYDFYLDQPSRLWGVSPLTDQQIAGVIMGSLGEAASFAAFSLIFVRFFLTDEPDAESVDAAASPAAVRRRG